MSVVGEEVWLVIVTTEPAKDEPGNHSQAGYFIHAGAEGEQKDGVTRSPKPGATL